MGLDRSFLSMLEARLPWEKFTGQDVFGNDQYLPAQTIEAAVIAMNVNPGVQDNQRQDNREVSTATIITDAKGIGLQDRFTLRALPFFVASVENGSDEQGAALYQQVSLTTARRG